MPQLEDPNFRRAVVLMLEHNELGSFGLIVNHESNLEVADLIATLRVTWQGDPDAMVWSGGPVMPGSGWILHSGSELLPAADPSLDLALEGSGTVRVCEGLFLTTSQENIKLLAEEPPGNIRVLLGYAGWSAGQLAAEMARGSWLHADIDNEILFGSPAEEMWQRFIGKMGIDPEAIVQSLGVH
jgi:putative transcriptional regulator